MAVPTRGAGRVLTPFSSAGTYRRPVQVLAVENEMRRAVLMRQVAEISADDTSTC